MQEKPVIFIVEDEVIVADDLTETLINLRYTVAGTAKSGEMALEKIKELMPDLVLMDIHLAGKIDGIETAEKIRRLYGIPVIYLTAFSDKALLDRAKVTEPYGYIIKPYDERELQSVIEIASYKYTMDKKFKESEDHLQKLNNELEVRVATRTAALKQSEKFQESVIVNAKLWMTFLDTKANVVIWNKAAEEITGYSREEVIGHGKIWKWIYPDDAYRKEVTKKIIDIVSNKRYLENFETDIRTKTGERRKISWNTRELTGDDSERLGYIVVGNDITEQRKAEAFRETIIDNANVLITVLDSRGKILVWNTAAETITGYSRDEVIGTRDVWKWLYPDADYRRTITRQITSIITSRKYFEDLETTIVTKSGEQRIILWNTRQIGSVGDYQEIAIGRDVTERKQAEEALLAYISEMAMRLKNPVEIIRDNLQEIVNLINGGKLTKEEMVTMLEGQVRNATQIAANVQEFQKAIAEKNKEIPEAYRTFLEG